MFQLNLIATVEYYGKNVRLITEKLLSNHYYDFVGSDIHHQNHVNAFKNKVKVKSLPQLEKAINNNLFFKCFKNWFLYQFFLVSKKKTI